MAQPIAQPPSSTSSSHFKLNSLRCHASSLRKYGFRCRYILGFLATMTLLIMVMSIVFVAHAYFHRFGGQGFLKTRDGNYLGGEDTPRIFLPLRKIESTRKYRKQEAESLLRYLPWNARALEPGSSVPFYTCGDQRNSCETFDQPVNLFRFNHPLLFLTLKSQSRISVVQLVWIATRRLSQLRVYSAVTLQFLNGRVKYHRRIHPSVWTPRWSAPRLWVVGVVHPN
jgi:hypothetical protein